MADHGGVLIKVSKTYPSSQRCGCCGKINLEARDLSVRRWTCPDCGEEHDRDINTEEAPLHHLHPVLKKILNKHHAICILQMAIINVSDQNSGTFYIQQIWYYEGNTRTIRIGACRRVYGIGMLLKQCVMPNRLDFEKGSIKVLPKQKNDCFWYTGI